MLVTKFINVQMEKTEQSSPFGVCAPQNIHSFVHFFQQIVIEHWLFARYFVRGPAWRRHSPSLRVKSLSSSGTTHVT